MFVALRRPLTAEDLIEKARRLAGLSDFGDTGFRDGLDVFLQACTEEANLSLFGQYGLQWDVRRFLSNLLRLRHEELRAPQILAEPIRRPLFIAGLPRSGTTFLQSLLAMDESNQVPRVWQLIYPYPLAKDRRGDRRRQRVDRQLRVFEMLAPEFRRMHPIDADSPQECSEITAHIFASLRFDSTYSVPSYRRWLDGQGHLAAYRFHKRFLQHLQYQSGSRGSWVLKCPDHVFALEAIRAVYPDAGMVFVHREPLRVMASVARLTEVLRRPSTRRIDRKALGGQECDRWCAAAELMIHTADEDPFAEPIFHVHHHDLVRNPVATVAALYRHFGRDMDDAFAARIGRRVEEVPNGGYGANQYRFDTYGIDPDLLRERFAPYMARFSIVTSGERTRNEPAAAAISPVARSFGTGS
jgi:hypothetical protein